MSVRDRVAGKSRRRLVVPVQVSDPAQDLERAAAAAAFLLAARANPARADELPALEAAHTAALEAVRSHQVDIEFQALAPARLEELVADHSRGEDIDRDGLRAALAAACATDPELQDVAWWVAQLDPQTGSWSSGERDDLYHQLLTVLHYSVPAGALPKG